MNEINKYNEKAFEDIKHINEFGLEYWEARELMPILQYSNWQNFVKIIHKAIVACENSHISTINHFIDVNKMVNIGSGAKRSQKDYKLTRYACYLIAQIGQMKNNIKRVDFLCFMEKISNRHIILENCKNNEKCNDFII